MILLLGGTGEARALAALLVADGIPVTSSLAGRVSAPALPVGAVRLGGFGGVAGLTAYLRAEGVDAVVDATHPFAERISASAAAACARTGVPLVRLQRPGWTSHPHAHTWTWVNDVTAAADAAEDARRPFLTTGRQSLDAFRRWTDRPVLVRVVDPPTMPLPPTWTVLRARGPYTLDGERALLRAHRIDRLLTKDSGGALTDAKLDAAAELGVAVVVVRRPDPPDGVPLVTDPDTALGAVRGVLHRAE